MILENQEETKKLCKVEEIGEFKIDDIDIFKTSFWNEPIPSRKMDAVVDKNLRQRLKSKEKANVQE